MLKIFTEKFANKEADIQNWLFQKHQNFKGIVYSSIDIRNSGFKICPIDVNVFPGGWNNICPNYCKEATKKFAEYFEKNHKHVKKILIFPEGHTKNKYYFDNLRVLQEMLTNSGFEVLISHTNEEFETEQWLETAENKNIKLHRLIKLDNKVQTKCAFIPDIILLNNDLSSGVPDILHGIDQPILPSPQMGWFRRSKIENLQIYSKLMEEFCHIVDLDPWYFTPITIEIENVDFQSKDGFEKIVQGMESVFSEINKKHKEHDIPSKPLIFIKNSAGTYGMGVKSFESVEDFININRKDRNKLSIGKGNQKIEKVIIQEGVPSIERFNGQVCEPVIYNVGAYPIGGFLRINDQKSDRENLNSKGMQFSKLCFHQMNKHHEVLNYDCDLKSLQNLYFIISEIASIAASIEEKNNL